MLKLGKLRIGHNKIITPILSSEVFGHSFEMETILRIIFIIVFLHPATPISPPARNVKIARIDWWRGARFAGTTINKNVRESGSPFELMECFDLCLQDTKCGAFWIRVTIE